jgi:hypothetical protein
MSLADWRRQTAVNLDGVFLSVKYAVAPSLSRPQPTVFAGRQGWPVIARRREVCASSLRRLRWNARQNPMGYG